MPKAVEIFGTGPRRAVALHCSLARGSAWGPLGARLGDLLTLEAPDLTGHGDAPDWVPEVAYHEQALAIIDKIVGPGPVDLFGHSLGAVLALAFAVKNPARVQSLILYEPVLFAALDDRAPKLKTQSRDQLADVLAFLSQGDREEAAKVFTSVWGGSQSWDQIPAGQRDYIAKRIHLIPAGNPLLYEDASGILAPGALEAVKAPALVLHGDCSPAAAGVIQEVLEVRLPNARRCEIKGGGHMAPITRSAEVAALVRPFLTNFGA